MQPTINLAQAGTQAETYAAEAHAHIPGALPLDRPSRTSLECDDPTDGGPPGRFDLADVYILAFPTGTVPDNTAIIDGLYDFWAGQGYHPIDDTRTNSRGRVIRFENLRDGFRFGLVEAVTTPQLTLEISSPCVWPDGTPSPA
jgi:hypothetical protein